MRTAMVVLAALAAADLIGCGLLLAVVWAEHRRQRRAAVAAGQPVPPPATGQFVAVGLFCLGSLGLLYGVFWVLLDG